MHVFWDQISQIFGVELFGHVNHSTHCLTKQSYKPAILATCFIHQSVVHTTIFIIGKLTRWLAGIVATGLYLLFIRQKEEVVDQLIHWLD